MKKKSLYLAIGLLAIVGILFFACDNGTSSGTKGNEPTPSGPGGDEPPPSGSEVHLQAFSPDSTTYILDSKSAVLSAMTRSVSLVIGNIYELTIIKPKAQNNTGAAENFDSDKYIVTVQSKQTLGNGKEKFTILRSDNNSTFFITIDSNGMQSIQGFQGTGVGEFLLTPIGESSNDLEGLWVGFSPSVDKHTDPYTYYIDPMSFYIEENFMISSTTNNYGGPNESFMQDKIEIEIIGNTIRFTENQFKRDSSGEWILDFDLARTDHSFLKEGVFVINGDILSFEATEEYNPGNENSVMGFEFEYKRVPMN